LLRTVIDRVILLFVRK